MYEVVNDFIKKYEYKNYYIYIKETSDSYCYYLQHKDYSVLYMIYGVDKTQNTIDDLIVIIKHNIEDDIEFYKENYEF